MAAILFLALAAGKRANTAKRCVFSCVACGLCSCECGLGKAQVTMTEYWVSKVRYWCKYCKCWMADTKAARFKHEQGIRHKEAVLEWMKENRQKKKDEQREKDELAREMAAIEKAARQQFKTDVESGTAKYNAPAGGGAIPGYGYGGGYGGIQTMLPLPGGGPSGGFPGGRPPGPPGPPPRPGGDRPGAPPPPPPKAKTKEDAALAEELAKEGIILKVEADVAAAAEAEGGGSSGAGAAAFDHRPQLWWQYKPGKLGQRRRV